MMVIGLDSGKEIMVQDKSFYITINGVVKQVFMSENGIRRYTIPEDRIEFYDEVNTSEYMDKLHESVKQTTQAQKKAKVGVDYA